MKLSVGRIVKADQLSGATVARLSSDEKTLPRGQVVRVEVLAAAERARSLVAAAEELAATILRDARQAAAELRLCAETEARADAAATIAARALSLRRHEARADERALDRIVELATILAERLLGETLRVAPEQVVSLAKQALTEARGARRILVVAHPEDAQILEQALPLLGLEAGLTQVRADTSRARGSLRLETEIGVLDAELSPQLERLSLRLRESLGHEN